MHDMMQQLLFVTVIFLSAWFAAGQFPTVCNNPTSLDTKTCCPNNCGGVERGRCENISALASDQLETANSTVVDILFNAPNISGKGTADARYRWPTVVFEKVCVCKDNYWGPDCNECNFGWDGFKCNTRKTPVIRKSFASLTKEEKQTFIDATNELKQETGIWSVVVAEPPDYSTGTVMLQDVPTYDFFIYLHYYVARDRQCSEVNENVSIDFAHSGPVFPVWHRRYMLTVEREFQRITQNQSFGFPYWEWEQNERSMFADEYYGVPSNEYGPAVDVMGEIINPENWNTICDITYWNPTVSCEDSWRPCNPAADLAQRNPLQRGGGSTYLPNIVEVMIAIAAPSYDAPDETGQYFKNAPRTSFRSRLEGWNIICSAAKCTGPQDDLNTHMHNNVHLWVGGQMVDVPAAVNDPLFNIHHCNVDRIIESWMQRFANGQRSPLLLPAYVPVSDGHPGHNRDDYMVPFFPLITAGGQYRVAEEWGYVYDVLIPADILDESIPDCADVVIQNNCPICDANATCIDCTDEVCPFPFPEVDSLDTDDDDDDDDDTVVLGVGVGLGIALLIAIIIIVILIIEICVIKCRSKNSSKGGQGVEMTVKS